MSIFLWLLVAHFIGDFVLQTNWQAMNKSSNNTALSRHVLTYSLCFMPWGIKFVLLTFALHWAVDYVTSRKTSQNWFIGLYERPDFDVFPDGRDGISHFGAYSHFAYFDANKRFWFWKWIGIDQLIHAFCLVGTYWLINGVV